MNIMRMLLNERVTGRRTCQAEETVGAKFLANCNSENLEVTCFAGREREIICGLFVQWSQLGGLNLHVPILIILKNIIFCEKVNLFGCISVGFKNTQNGIYCSWLHSYAIKGQNNHGNDIQQI